MNKKKSQDTRKNKKNKAKYKNSPTHVQACTPSQYKIKVSFQEGKHREGHPYSDNWTTGTKVKHFLGKKKFLCRVRCTESIQHHCLHISYTCSTSTEI